MKQIYSAQDPLEAHYVKGLLETQGIACDVRGESLFGARGELPMTIETAPSLWIHDDSQLSDAIEIIKEYESLDYKNNTTEFSWVCTSCGQEMEGQFSECWHCLEPKKI